MGLLSTKLALCAAWLVYAASGDLGVLQKYQHTQWNPGNTTLDAKYVAAAKQLMGNGLSDPKGGRFCKVSGQYPVASASDDIAYGWVLPGDKRVVLVDGSEDDVRGTIEPAIIEDVLPRLERAFQSASSSEYVPGISVCTPALLLRMGKPRLAERVLKCMSFCTAQLLAEDSISKLTQQTIREFSKGDYRTARNCGNQLLLAWQIKHENHSGPSLFFGGIDFEATQRLRADIQRRIDHPTKPLNFELLTKRPQGERIRSLIGALDSVQGEQPHKLVSEISDDPVVKALVHEGDAAVPALIEAVSTDQRISKAVFTDYNVFNDLYVLSVKDVAWDILQAIWPTAATLEVSDSKSQSGKGPPSLNVLRHKWSTLAHVSQAARWMLVLQDDHDPARSWVDAAAALVTPAGRASAPYIYVASSDRAPMTGATLPTRERAKASQLMECRAEQILAGRVLGEASWSPSLDALAICDDLYKWDREHCVPCLSRVSDAILRRQFKDENAPQDEEMKAFVKVIAERSRAGDVTAATDYQRMFSYLDSLHKLGELALFRPYWECLGDTAIQRVGANRMSQWAADFSSSNADVVWDAANEDFCSSPNVSLMIQPTFRRALVAGFHNHVALQTLHVTGQGTDLSYSVSGIGGGGWEATVDAAECPGWKAGMTRKVECCDYLASKITFGWDEGVPKFELLWSENKRATARSAFIAWLSNDKLDWAKIVKSNAWAFRTPAE